MDGSSFDTLARAFSTSRARRGLAQLLLGAALGGTQALAGLNEAEARRGQRRKRQKRRDQRRRDRNQRPSDAPQAEGKKRKKKACPPCRKRKKGKCKGTLPDGAAGWHSDSAGAGAAGNVIISGRQQGEDAVFAPLVLGLVQVFVLFLGLRQLSLRSAADRLEGAAVHLDHELRDQRSLSDLRR